MSDNTPYEDGDGTEVARLVRERDNTADVYNAWIEFHKRRPDTAAAITQRLRDQDAEIKRLRARVAELERKLTKRNTGL